MIDNYPDLFKAFIDKKDVNIMDIGCNEGYAMSKFKELGYENIQGITVKKEEWDICKEKGLNVHHMNYNFSKMMDGFFQVIWMRQSIQFSIAFFTLLELNRILKMKFLLGNIIRYIKC